MKLHYIPPKRSGLPPYVRSVVRLRSDGTRHENFYVHRGDFRVRVPAPTDPSFSSAYADAMQQMERHYGSLEPWTHGDPTITKDAVEKYFVPRHNSAKSRAKAANREFALPRGWIAAKYIEQGGICALSGVKMRLARGLRDPFCPTIDRIDSEKGYTPDNCQIIALQVNLAKNNLSERNFIRMCRAVASYGPKRLKNGS